MEQPQSISISELWEKLPKIEWAPLNVPWERHIQMLAFYIYFDETHENGGRRIEWYRRLDIWKWLINYFPISIIKESELDANKNYIFASHPHGIHATSVILGFGTEGLNISKIFPGIKSYFATTNFSFGVPLYREFIMGISGIGASKRSIENIFNKGKGHSVVLIIGGVEESLHASADASDLVLAKRYGFIKLAIKNGASIVPTYSFNENKLFDFYPQPDGSPIRTIQAKMKNHLGFTWPMFVGRGIFTYNYGFFPKQIPLTIVTGNPIHLEKDENPCHKKIQKVHQQYMEALKDLYDRNKEQYFVGEIPQLRFI